MLKKVICNTRFLIGLFILVTIIISSYITKEKVDAGKIKPIPPYQYVDGKITSTAPAPPSFSHPLGVDKDGDDVLIRTLYDAKTPIFYAVIISFFRITFSLIFGILHAYFYRYVRFLDILFETFQYVPTTLLAIFLLSPVLFVSPEDEQLWLTYTLSVLIFISVPNLVQLFSNEIRLLLQNEFVTSSKTLGGGFFHICKLHLKPFLTPKIFIWINQQMLQTLVLLLHLALFRTISFNIAGTLVLLGHNHQFLNVLPWIAFGPVLFFTIAILAVYMMLSGMQNVLEKDINYMENSLLLSVLSKDKRERKRKYFSLFKQNIKMKEQ
ncbi:peptide ABC transporter permease [Bacillus sp. CDB3]|uniref:peptide ABC transporter permease n=1 Tax=Bacillus sp. CDB3 TaxID=360310 RepID=UPI0009D7D274|nr:peptide ABC transporter permease [Bacillus sp. CDB3]OQR56174.1 peptide ABC transporter permease [Bacillus sp. CDB3]